jgi:hypothetical protein
MLREFVVSSLASSPFATDCWMNHYDDYYWFELVEANIAQYWETLGYTQLVSHLHAFEPSLRSRFLDIPSLILHNFSSRQLWEGSDAETPESMKKDWVDLTTAEKEALINVCYIEPLWEGQELEDWVYKAEYYFVKDWPLSDFPSDVPSMIPSDVPSMIPSDTPSSVPSPAPSPLVRRRDLQE